jgi:dihydropteroate synthase
VFPPRPLYSVPIAHRGPLILGERCLVMGILNITPDSFAESAARLDPAIAVEAALRMEADGADLIDIGAESTRPGAQPVSADVELARLLPVLAGLRGRLTMPISVDTTKAEVATAAVAAGAAIVNDVSGLQRDPALGPAVAATEAAVILMHMRGQPASMYAQAVYGDLVREVTSELLESIKRARDAGIPLERVVVDPGLGFAKRPAHSYGVLAALPDLAAGLARPMLVGASRKSFMRDALDDRPANQRDWGTAAAVTAAVLAGAHIVRVHAVAEMVQVVRVAEEIRRAGMSHQR